MDADSQPNDWQVKELSGCGPICTGARVLCQAPGMQQQARQIPGPHGGGRRVNKQATETVQIVSHAQGRGSGGECQAGMCDLPGVGRGPGVSPTCTSM